MLTAYLPCANTAQKISGNQGGGGGSGGNAGYVPSGGYGQNSGGYGQGTGGYTNQQGGSSGSSGGGLFDSLKTAGGSFLKDFLSGKQ